MKKADFVFETLRRDLQSGLYPLGSRFPSEYELMEKFNCSRIVTNKAVELLVRDGLLVRGRRGAGTFVRETERFPEGYFAVLCDVESTFLAPIIFGISEMAIEHNYLVCQIIPNFSTSQRLLEKLHHSDCKGIFSLTWGILPPDEPLPVVYPDLNIAENISASVNYVANNNFEIAEALMERIAAVGHREIVYCGDPRFKHRVERRDGFAAALVRAGVADADERYFFCPPSMQNLVKKILGKYPQTTFIATDSDDIACMILLELKELGLLEKIGVSGFGNIACNSTIARIPTVEQFPRRIGGLACQLMLELLEKSTASAPRREIIRAELMNLDMLRKPSCP